MDLSHTELKMDNNVNASKNLCEKKMKSLKHFESNGMVTKIDVSYYM